MNLDFSRLPMAEGGVTDKSRQKLRRTESAEYLP
jgi:hypothetical protein